MLLPALVLLATCTSPNPTEFAGLPALPHSPPERPQLGPSQLNFDPSPMPDKNEGVSSVEGELKEQIRTLQAECKSLKAECLSLKQQPPPAATSQPAHSGHGAGLACATDADYHSESILRSTLTRASWLAVFLVSLSLTSVVLSGFEHTLQTQVELSYFVPLLIGHGGNAGGQTIGAVLAAMSSGQITQRDFVRVVGKECVTGVGIGVFIALATVPLLFTLHISWHVSVAIMLTVPALTVLSLGLAASLPFLCVALGQDPTVVAAPAMTTLVDVGGLLLYFLVAHVVFHACGITLGPSAAGAVAAGAVPPPVPLPPLT